MLFWRRKSVDPHASSSGAEIMIINMPTESLRKTSLIEQLIPKNALRESTSNQTGHLIGPFLVLVSLLAVLQIGMH